MEDPDSMFRFEIWDHRRIEYYRERNGCSLIQLLRRYLHGVTEEKYNNS
jgi:hypothetical protein